MFQSVITAKGQQDGTVEGGNGRYCVPLSSVGDVSAEVPERWREAQSGVCGETLGGSLVRHGPWSASSVRTVFRFVNRAGKMEGLGKQEKMTEVGLIAQP